MKNFHHLINKVIFRRGNLLLYLFLLFSTLARLNSKLYFIDIIGQLGFQIIISGILLFFVFLIQKKLLSSFICAFVCVFLIIDILSSCNQCNALLKNKIENNNETRLMTFNTGLSNDFKNIKELILSENPEVVQLQEVSPKILNNLKSLKSTFPYNTGLDKPPEQFTNVVLSKHPLKDIKILDNYAVMIKIIYNENEINIIGIHLMPPLNPFLLDIIINLYSKYNESIKPKSLARVGYDFSVKQMKYLKDIISDTNQNLIIMGDLNMTSTSKRFTNFLNDTDLYTYVSYKNPTYTWPTFLPNYLGIQIDHILFSKNFSVIKKTTANHFGSDHRPLIVDLAF